MKNGKVPTRRRRDIIRDHGLNPDEYLVVKNTAKYLEVVSRMALKKEKVTGKRARTRKLYLEQGG